MTKEQAAEQAYPTIRYSNFSDEYTLPQIREMQQNAYKEGWGAKPSDAVEFVQWLTVSHTNVGQDWIKRKCAIENVDLYDLYEQFKNQQPK